jgi:hypothetical protein
MRCTLLFAIGIPSALIVLELLGRVVNRIGIAISPQQIPAYIEKIMRAGGNNTRMFLMAERHHVEFLKQINSAGLTRFCIVVQHRRSKPHDFDLVAQYLTSSRSPYKLENADSSGSERIVVDIGRNVGYASRITRDLLYSVFGVPANAKLKASFVGCLDVREGAMVGWANQIRGH